LGELKQAIMASDPMAIELADKLVTAPSNNDSVVATLAALRSSLDNFDFDSAKPILAELEQALAKE